VSIKHGKPYGRSLIISAIPLDIMVYANRLQTAALRFSVDLAEHKFVSVDLSEHLWLGS
jgi:hypothetical protein